MSKIPESCEVVIVGGGIAGASAAYHLADAGIQNIVVLERGTPGNGSTRSLQGDTEPQAGTDEETVFSFAQRSGTAVMPAASTIKMMVRLFASSAEDFISHHGEEGAARYLKLTTIGLGTEKDLARRFLPDPATQIRNTGSLYLAHEKDAADLKNEFELLKRLGCDDIEWWEKDKLSVTPGCSPQFHCAIFFPEDAIINSSMFSAALLKAAVGMGGVQLVTHACPVASVSTVHHSAAASKEDAYTALTVLEDGTRISSKHVILATGGLFTNDPNLSGILRPCWSYLVAMPHPEVRATAASAAAAPTAEALSDGTPLFSYNFFTWGFTHDWAWTNGAIRISGEDHFSALKAPRGKERCQKLARWTKQAYPQVFNDAGTGEGEAVDTAAYDWQYGVYSETPDAVPIVGQTSAKSRVCYLLGCNAWGQAVLSYAATLIPGLLGYRELDEEESDLFSLLTVRRFSLLPSIRKEGKETP
jgi:glycine/D-amino acid oxidase-like deaminating enzyme